MDSRTKLELTWIGKDNRPKLEPRILVEDPEKSYHATFRRGREEEDLTAKSAENAEKEEDSMRSLRSMRFNDSPDLFDNRLIFGDNLLALKALEQEFTGKIKCIYIDPPYNTGSAFTHYDDGVEHSIWLSLMRDRLEILRRLLSEDGSIWVNLDDNEAHYCKVLMDEVFGRINFVTNVIWWKKSSPQSNAVWMSESHDHILVFAKNKETWRPGKLERTEAQNAIYKQSDEHDGIDEFGKSYGRGPWFPGDFTIGLSSGQRGKQFAKTGHSDNIYEIITPSGRVALPAKGRAWAYVKSSYERLRADNRVYFGKDGSNKPCIKRFLSEIEDKGVVAMTTWHYDEVGENRIAMQEAKTFNENDPFGTPKPEKLVHRILSLSSNPGDWVLDSFAGSGTTGAVAHKMGRRWIMVELGEHCHTHIIPRMKKVIDGEDQGGISKAVNWKGGGGFRYSRLGPSLIVKDEWENPVINPEFNAAMLAEAMCKLEGFTFEPNADIYWQQGRSSETDFIYVTTQMMTKEMLTKLSDEVGPNRSLLICCGAFRCDVSQFENLTVKKIPKAVLKKCEWGHDDYSLEIRNLPVRIEESITAKNAENAKGKEKPARRFGKGKARDTGPTLFDMEGLK